MQRPDCTWWVCHEEEGTQVHGERRLVCGCGCVCVLSACLLGKCKNIAERWSDREAVAVIFPLVMTYDTTDSTQAPQSIQLWCLDPETRRKSPKKKGKEKTPSSQPHMPPLGANRILSRAYGEGSGTFWRWNVAPTARRVEESWTPVFETVGEPTVAAEGQTAMSKYGCTINLEDGITSWDVSFQ